MTKAIQKILSLIPDSILDPFFVIEASGKILFMNKQGADILSISETGESIIESLTNGSKVRLNEILDKAFELNESLTVDKIELQLRSGKEIKIKLILNPFESSGHLYSFCTMIPQTYKPGYLGLSHVKLDDVSTEQLIKNKKIIELIGKIEEQYPLTFIGKDIIHKIADDLNEVFWIVDNEGRFILVNDYFANAIGLKPHQLESKLAEDFLPGYLKDMNHTVNKFIRDSLNCILLDGFYFRENEALKNKEIIQLPLFDDDYNLNCIIGFSQQSEMDFRETETKKSLENLYGIIRHFPKPVAFITPKGNVKHCSEDFCKLFQRKIEDLDGLNFAEFLPESLAESINRFIISTDNSRFLPANRQIELEKNDEPEYTIYLTKYFDNENKLEGFSIILEKIEYAENLPQLLKNRGRMFEFLIENNPEPIYIYDKENLQFLEANTAALELYGYSKDEFLQMDITDLYNPEDIQTLLGSTDDKDVEGKFNGPFRHRKKDGNSVFVELSKMSFKYNERDAHFIIVRNVTESLKLGIDNQLFKAVFDNTADLIFVTDPDGIITYVNGIVVNTLGISKDDLENSSMTSLVNEEDRTTIISSIFQSHMKEAVELTVNLKSSEDKFLETEISATPVLDFNGNVDSFIILGKRGKVQGTETIVKEVVKEVVVEKPAEVKTEETSQLESTFLKGVFHEILTPMNVILGFAQELTEGIENLSPDQKEAVDIINQNRGKLLSTMNAIIEYSEVLKSKNEWNLTTLAITKVVEDLDKNFYEITGSSEINFAYGRISSSLQFETDKQKFDCLLNNLVRLISRLCKDNKLYLSAYPVDKNNFMISISDNYGSTSSFLVNALNKLFTEKRDPKEVGLPKLGAQISQSLLELLQVKFVINEGESGKQECGFIFPISYSEQPVESKVEDEVVPEDETIQEPVAEKEEQAGEEFPLEQENEIEIEEETVIDQTEELPVKDETIKQEPVATTEDKFEIAEPPAEESLKTEAGIELDQVDEFALPETVEKAGEVSEDKLDLSNLCCLYIEDQVDSQILFKVQMKGLKDIKYAVSFEEAVPLLETEHFDFIVMDINLQGEYNGLDALKIIHKMSGYEGMPIIAVTAYVLPGDKDKFIAAGFDDFVSKPIFREKMVESLEKIFLQKA